jgi:hypothetical protein
MVKDVNQIVDDAAERAKRELHENTTSHCGRLAPDQKTTPKFRVVGIFRPDPTDEADGRED